MFEVQSEKMGPRLMLDQRVPMRDGVELSADVYLPGDGDGPWPVILQRTPYDNSRGRGIEQAAYFTEHGYAMVLQDVRGRGRFRRELGTVCRPGPGRSRHCRLDRPAGVVR